MSADVLYEIDLMNELSLPVHTNNLILAAAVAFNKEVQFEDVSQYNYL